MKPVTLLIILLCAWALTNFWLVPLTSKRWRASTLRQKVTRAGTLAVLEKVRDLTLVGLLTIAVVMLFVAAVTIAGSLPISSPGVIAALASTYSIAKSWSENYSMVIGTLALLGAILSLYLSARRARRQVVDAWDARVGEVLNSFKAGPETIDAAADDPELRPLVERLKAAIAEFHALRERSGSTAEAVEAARIQIVGMFDALAIEIAAKGLDVEEILRQPSEVPPPTSRWQRMLHVLSSEQLAKDMGLLSKPLSYVLSALLVINLLGWVADPLANSMQLAINNLRVNVLAQQAQKDLDEAISIQDLAPESEPANDPPDPAVDDVAHVAQVLANVALDGLLRTSLSGETYAARTATINEAHFVRATILGETLEAANDADPAQKIRAETAQAVDQAGVGKSAEAERAVRTKLEEEIRPTVEKLKHNNPDLFTRISRRYASPMGVVDAQGKLMSEVLSQAFGAVNVDPTTEAGRQAQRIIKEFGNKAANTWIKSKANEFVADAIMDSARPERVERRIKGSLRGPRVEVIASLCPRQMELSNLIQ